MQYPAFCLAASLDDAVFAAFRRHPAYNRVLEHVSESLGRAYLDVVRRDPAWCSSLNAFRQNDLWGEPRVYAYAGAGVFSPTTLRYAKVLHDLVALFGSLDALRICEIGVGYGGQCRVISCLFQPALYCLVDIKPALMLAQRYLDCFPLRLSLRYQTMHELGCETWDLVISNYAFTELRREYQEVHLTKVLRNARCGYVTYNQMTPPDFRSLTRDEILSAIPGARAVDEVPKTAPGNCVIVWGPSRVEAPEHP